MAKHLLMILSLFFFSCVEDNKSSNDYELLCNENLNIQEFLDSGIQIISAKELADNYMNDTEYVLIDNRPKSKFSRGHIPGAINLTYFKDGSLENVLNKNILKETIKSKSVIFYCTGFFRACHASIDSIKKWGLLKQKVFWFKGGIREWIDNGYKLATDDG